MRKSLISNTFPFNTLGWPALVIPAGRQDMVFPHPVQLAGRRGTDLPVLAAGTLLEASLSA